MKFLEKAIELSYNNIVNNKGGPFGCVIVKDDKIVATGVNSVVIDNDPTAHAEINAIRYASKNLETFDLSNCILYSSCQPCPMCYSAIKWAKINKVYYANTRYDAEKIGFNDNHIYELIETLNSNEDMVHVHSDSALKVFDLWIKDKKNILY
jgi:tRNA(Arg) A34 adenosine deaminase TadA